MRIYLVQHGDCVDKEVDPDQPLSEKGIKDINRLAHFLSKHDIIVSRFYHSTKLRAKETAELLATNITSLNSIEVLQGITPMDPVSPIVERINTWKEDTLLVGHLPFLSHCVAKLICNDEKSTVVSFERGAMLCLEKSSNGSWSIYWMLRPELLVD
jgi:phosphohistidine phosphatase